MIPLSSRIDKFRKIIEKKEQVGCNLTEYLTKRTF